MDVIAKDKTRNCWPVQVSSTNESAMESGSVSEPNCQNAFSSNSIPGHFLFPTAISAVAAVENFNGLGDFKMEAVSSSGKIVRSPDKGENYTEVERGCHSPESGFGSEFGYSPSETIRVNSNLWGATEESKEIKNEIETLENVCQPVAGTTQQDFFQIVSVKSLATKASPFKSQKKSDSSTTDRGDTHMFPVKCTKRLHIRKYKGKNILFFKPEPQVTDEKLSDVDIDVTRNTSLSLSVEKSPNLMISGVPALMYRPTCIFTPDRAKRFVTDLFFSQPPNITNSSVENVISEGAVFRENTGKTFPTKTSKLNLTRSKRCIAAPVVSPTVKHKEKCVIIKSCDDVKNESRLHSNVSEIKQPSTTNKLLQCKLNKGIVSQSFETTAKRNANKNKSDRIERLKEILRKKEKDLEQVRRNCGFIS